MYVEQSRRADKPIWHNVRDFVCLDDAEKFFRIATESTIGVEYRIAEPYTEYREITFFNDTLNNSDV